MFFMPRRPRVQAGDASTFTLVLPVSDMLLWKWLYQQLDMTINSPQLIGKTFIPISLGCGALAISSEIIGRTLYIQFYHNGK